MDFITNKEIDLAFDYVRNTNKNIFLTGKAGTGKTTFLRAVRKAGFKRMVVVAPTGVAAINAGGMTIHSFFQLPFGPQLPGVNVQDNRWSKLRAKKINLIRSLDLLVIDEISMVRADLLDGIDRVLRQYRDKRKAFGGVQLLMIGDLHQLPPVVKPQEWELLRDYYKTPYFFGSLGIQEVGMVTIQLKHIYRQSDDRFINLLNKVRTNQMDTEVLTALNSRYSENLPGEDEDYITLTARNAPANKINIERLQSLQQSVHVFNATVDGDFPEQSFPTVKELELKVGAQVMFVKNDLSPEKRFYNGKIGKVISINKETIKVQCKDDPSLIFVSRMEWTNVKYELNKTTKVVEEKIKGTFIQFPLKLAWAITIHKSQGLTFERVIIDAANAFAHGQTYVALSRCKSFEGIVLRSRLAYASVKTDSVVQNYSEDAEKNPPSKEDLLTAKKEYQQSLILQLFDFKMVRRYFQILNRLFLEHDLTIAEPALKRFLELEGKTEDEVFAMAEKFLPQLYSYLRQEEVPEENEELQKRLQKAGHYFSKKIKDEILPEVRTLDVITDNEGVRDKATDGIKNLLKELMIKAACFANCTKSFSVNDYVQTKLEISLNDKIGKNLSKINDTRSKSEHSGKGAEDSAHPELYQEIRQWRDTTAEKEEVNVYQVVTLNTMFQLVKCLPTTETNLKKISGLGKVKVENYGDDIISIIKEFVAEKGIPSDQMPEPKQKVKKAPTKTPTKQVSFDLFKAGKTVLEIAKERGLVEGTIENHLAFFITTGEVHVHELIDKVKVTELSNYLKAEPEKSSKEVVDHFGGRVSYSELLMVRNHMALTEPGVIDS
ncbi:MAG: helix-turn-helix domain-containing protein [Saprospiraceae bacterium]